jgi:hypothetical protein
MAVELLRVLADPKFRLGRLADAGGDPRPGAHRHRPGPFDHAFGGARFFQRANYPACDIEAGEMLRTENVSVLLSNHAIDVRDYYVVVGHLAH